MRSYCAVYVDVGYLLASAATRVTGTSLRGGVTIVYRELIEALIAQAEAESGLPLLRVNWYDAGSSTGGAPDGYQEQIGMLPRVKLRLGRMSPGGEQKGVDLRIGLDLATHGRNRLADVMYLVSGDDDLTEAVEEAQGHGVQVVLLAAPNAQGRAHAVSRHLQREADGIVVIDPLTIDRNVRARKAPVEVADAATSADGAVAVNGSSSTPAKGAAIASVPRPTPADFAGRKASLPALPKPVDHRLTRPPELVYSSTTGVGSIDHLGPDDRLIDEVVRGVVGTWKKTITEAERRSVVSERPNIPRELDKALLVDLSDRLGVYDIDERSRFVLRERFWQLLD
ncbi:MAG: NYN domain-containing protein [Humibacillus sp.]|nr:NYN domain-containing protein [Humibacillus sp.]MDN5776796.1 NYN domain-containing protein [Humibacillus sp.]